MAARSPEERMVVVRLSQVPEKKRVEVADRIIRLEELKGVPALLMKMAAVEPVENPSIEVPESLARKVCGR